MLQLILHLLGDYVTQSDWMATNKTKSTWAALCHASVYSAPFYGKTARLLDTRAIDLRGWLCGF